MIRLILHSSILQRLDWAGYFGMDVKEEEELKKHSLDTSDCLSETSFLEQVLPSLASIPDLTAWQDHRPPWRKPVSKLHSVIRQIHSGKLGRPLQGQEILDLGNQIKGTSYHGLDLLAGYLVNEHVADEMVRICNDRYQ